MNKNGMLRSRQVFLNGIITENPVFRLVLGTCPTMAVTTSAVNGIGMGLAATFVLICSNVLISLLRIRSKTQMTAHAGQHVKIEEYSSIAGVSISLGDMGLFRSLI